MQTFVLWQRSTFTALAHLLVIVFYIQIYKSCRYRSGTNRKRGKLEAGSVSKHLAINLYSDTGVKLHTSLTLAQIQVFMLFHIN
jgi:hypothetical protein